MTTYSVLCPTCAKKYYFSSWSAADKKERELYKPLRELEALRAENARLRAIAEAADGMAEALKQSLLPYSNEINTLWVRSLSQTALDAYNAALRKPAK